MRHPKTLIKERAFSFLTIIATLCFSIPGYALNGLQLEGVGAVHRSVGGAGVAKPLDSMTVLLNPAGMNGVGRRFDLGFTIGFPKVSMNTSTTALGGNNASSQDEGVLLPTVSAVFPFLDDRWAFGFMAAATGGFSVDYAASRLPTPLTGGAYDRSTRYGNFKIIPGLSYKILDNLTAGIGFHMNLAQFQTDSATAAAGFPQTAGLGRFDQAVGVGGSIGLIYNPLPWLSAGATYTTRQYFEDFDRYADLILDSIDIPQQVAAGVAISPPQIPGGLLLADFRWIPWSNVGTLGTSPAAGGFGWRDQYVIGAGLQYDCQEKFDLPVALRAGYNYGRSPISSSVTFANILAPVIMNHHLGGGLSYRFTEKMGAHASFTHYLSNRITDNGSISGAAVAGASLTTSANLFTLQIHRVF